jgi:predicted nucleic acid-binding protein
MIGFYDLIVAAAAWERETQIAGFDKRHFAQIEGLVL